MDHGLPAFLTIEEASRLLRIGRTKAYLLSQEWRTTGGRSGLPVVDLGDVLRVPGPAIAEMLKVGLCAPAPIVPARARPLEPAATAEAAVTTIALEPAPAPTSKPAPTRRTRRPHQRPTDQLPLFPPLPSTAPDPA